ncbi:MAG TPA: adenylyltransferase/cytidyltransferase family protein [Myxococcales bacterium]|nr:adenylyltransferase/cytidyltransferase family protein [Myxococcales bacterium]
MICTLAQAAVLREATRQKGGLCAVTNGAFDLLHVGHVRYLLAARELAGANGLLVVGVNTDRSVRESKGPRRPLVPERERAELVDAVKGVDCVVLFDERTAETLLRELRPDLHVKGTDYTPDTVPERALVASFGGRTVIAGDPKDHSTTDFIKTLKARL